MTFRVSSIRQSPVVMAAVILLWSVVAMSSRAAVVTVNGCLVIDDTTGTYTESVDANFTQAGFAGSDTAQGDSWNGERDYGNQPTTTQASWTWGTGGAGDPALANGIYYVYVSWRNGAQGALGDANYAGTDGFAGATLDQAPGASSYADKITLNDGTRNIDFVSIGQVTINDGSFTLNMAPAAVAWVHADAAAIKLERQIMVVDADNSSSTAYDRSTGTQSTNGLTGVFTSNGLQFQASALSTAWNDEHGGFATTGEGDTATWTVSGYAPGATVSVYVHWHHQANTTPGLPYIVNGETPVVKNQENTPPVGNLRLTDPLSVRQPFEFIGTYAVDGAGQVQVEIGNPLDGPSNHDFGNVDAMAFETSPPSAPTVALPATAQAHETDTLTLTATIEGAPYPTLQWKTNGIAVPGATANPLVYPNIQLSQSGIEWSLEATNAGGADAATTTVTVVEGTQIMVVDADNTSWAAYDASTGAENTNGLSGSFFSDGLAFKNTGTAWNGEHGGYAQPGHGDRAEWTVTGYAPGSVVDIYVHWHHQANTTPGLPYIVNGGTPVVKVQENTAPSGDLMLTDPLLFSRPFELIGRYPVDMAGQILVEIGDPQDGPGDHDFGNVDAMAFQTVPNATYTLIEDFQSHALGADIDTANGWVEFGSAGGSVIQDPVLLGQKAARLPDAAANAGYALALGANTVPDGDVATLFLRYRTTGALSAYLTVADTFGSWWAVDDAGIHNNSGQTGQAVAPHWDDGATAAISYDEWYNVWVLVDLAANRYNLYISQEFDPATGGASSVTVDTDVGFSGGDTGDFDHFFFASGNGDDGGMIDDIYIAQGANLLLPADIQPTQGSLFMIK